jgi:AmmeMemoRadiSam system protein B
MVDARRPAAAGVFYPAERDALAERLRTLLDQAASARPARPPPRARAIVVPHAMIGPAGSVAAAAWDRVACAEPRPRRVVLLGPAHHVPFAGMAAPYADAFATPLGAVAVDRLAIEGLRRFAQLAINDLPHEQEPSLEAQLPFVQTVAPDARVVPIVVGELPDEEAAEVIDAAWDDATLVVVSTDLSRYFDLEAARRLDEHTAGAIESLQGIPITEERACAHGALRAVLRVARARKLTAKRLRLGHSGEATGDVDEVVGYGAFVFV